MIELLIALVSGALFAMRGSGLPKALWYAVMVAIIYGVTMSLYDTALWLWVLIVAGSLPTHAMFSAIHGNPPGRDDGNWQWLQELSRTINGALPAISSAELINSNWGAKRFGIIYGAVRSSLAIPAIILLGKPWLLLLLLQGGMLYVAGKFCGNKTVRVVEFCVGAIIGWNL